MQDAGSVDPESIAAKARERLLNIKQAKEQSSPKEIGVVISKTETDARTIPKLPAKSTSVSKTEPSIKKINVPVTKASEKPKSYSNWQGPSGYVSSKKDVINKEIAAAGVYSRRETQKEPLTFEEEYEPSTISSVLQKVDGLIGYADRAVGLYTGLNTDDPEIKIQDIPIIKPKIKEEEVDYNFFNRIQIPQDKGLFSYIRQSSNKDSLDYFTGPAKITYEKQKNKKPFERTNVEGIGHHLIMSVAEDLTDFTKADKLQQASKQVYSAIRNDEYVPIIRKHGDEKIKMTYRKKSDLDKEVDLNSEFMYGEPNVYSPIRLRQWKFSDLDFDNLGRGEKGFTSAKGVYDKKNKIHINSLVTSGSKDSYGEYSGGSAVFIFKDKKGKEIVREVTGSLNMIRNEGNKIADEFDLDKNDITIGVYDAGSVNYKRASDNNFKMKPERVYMHRTPGTMAGSSLIIPKGGKFKTGGSIMNKKQYAGPIRPYNTRIPFSDAYNNVMQEFLDAGLSEQDAEQEWLNSYNELYGSNIFKDPFNTVVTNTPILDKLFNTEPSKKYGFTPALGIDNAVIRNTTPINFFDGQPKLKEESIQIPKGSVKPSFAKTSGLGSRYDDIASIEEQLQSNIPIPTEKKAPTIQVPNFDWDIDADRYAKNAPMFVGRNIDSDETIYKKAQGGTDFDPEEEKINMYSNIFDYVEPGTYTDPNVIKAQNKAGVAVGANRNQPQNQNSVQTKASPASNNSNGYGTFRPVTPFANTIPIDRNTTPVQQTPRINTPRSGYDTFRTPQAQTFRTADESQNTPYNPEYSPVPKSQPEKSDSFTGPTVPDYAKDFGSDSGVENKQPGLFGSLVNEIQNNPADAALLGASFLNKMFTPPVDVNKPLRDFRTQGQAMSRGDWTTNRGVLQPNKMGYFDKFALGTGSMKNGGTMVGEAMMSDEEIFEFLANGGELEILE